MKTKLYIFIVIILSILALIFMQMNNTKELFVTGNTGFDYSKIDRISHGDHNYSYCIGGKITCNKTPLNSSLIEMTDVIDVYTGGKTYKPYCKTNGIEDISNQVYCDGSIFSKLNQSDMPEYRLPLSNSLFPISTYNLGFTQHYTYVPAAIDASNKNRLNFFKNQSGDVVEYRDICDVYYQTEQDNCKRVMYGSLNSTTITPALVDLSYSTINIPPNPESWNMPSTMEDDTSEYDGNILPSSIVSSTTTSKIYPPTDCNAKIPCVADFGTDIGDKLCCGQKGVLQNTKNICPSTKPKCTNFDCKTQLGYCQ
jgi:hypothetical protein